MKTWLKKLLSESKEVSSRRVGMVILYATAIFIAVYAVITKQNLAQAGTLAGVFTAAGSALPFTKNFSSAGQNIIENIKTEVINK